MIYDSRWIYNIPAEDFLDSDEILCSETKSIESFTYSIDDFYELWFIYAAAAGLSVGIYLLKLVLYYKKMKEGNFVLQGVRSHRDK